MMGVKNIDERNIVKSINLDKLVPENHTIRKIDISFIYDKVKHLYSPYGTKSIDPVVLFKIIMIWIRSMRQTIKEIQVNIAYRWYIGYGFDEQIPHFSTFGKNYKRRFEATDIFYEIFKQIFTEVAKCNFLDEENVFVDGTHIKANASNKKVLINLLKLALNSMKNLFKRKFLKIEKLIKKTLNFDEKTLIKRIKVSKTDSECVVFHKGEHKKVFAYSANTACDKNNFILGFVLTLWN